VRCHERYPARAIVEALKRRTVVDTSCDGEGMDDVRLLLNNGTTVTIDSELDTSPNAVAMADWLGRPPWPRLVVRIGGRELWPFADRVATPAVAAALRLTPSFRG